MDVSDRGKQALVLSAALLQGLIFLVLLPPWQHYDEPTHFEYAWLIANHGHRPAFGDEDAVMRREVAASMLQHNFYWNQPKPDLLAEGGGIEIGLSEIGHPPAYYLLVALPLLLVRHLDVTTQLYIARCVSLVLFLLTILVIAAIVHDLTPCGHMLRWVVPLTALLMPPFADLMTAVNNDVGAVFLVSLFLWGGARTIRFGLTFWRLLWIVGAGLLAVLTKNTASVALILAPFVILAAIWVQHGWPWRWFLLGTASILAMLAVAILDWGDAAYWYRWPEDFVQDSATRITNATAPVGQHAVRLDTTTTDPGHYLLSPVLAQDERLLAGRSVTVGGWIWADRAATVGGPGLVLGRPGTAEFETITHPVTVTTTPRFVSWTSTIPTQTVVLYYGLFGSPTETPERPLAVRLTGAVLVEGKELVDSVPIFDDDTARTGVWNGRHFTNLVRNPSGKQAWPRLRPWFEHALIRYVHRSPAQVLAALFDVERTGSFLLWIVTPMVLDGFFNGFAWGHVRLAGFAWPFFFRGLALIALAGCVKWTVLPNTAPSRAVGPALVFLACAGMLVGINTIMRPLPMLQAKILLPAARYAFPAIVPVVLTLAGGWWALWPRRYRAYGSYVFLLCLIVLDIASIWRIWAFYQSLPIS